LIEEYKNAAQMAGTAEEAEHGCKKQRREANDRWSRMRNRHSEACIQLFRLRKIIFTIYALPSFSGWCTLQMELVALLVITTAWQFSLWDSAFVCW